MAIRALELDTLGVVVIPRSVLAMFLSYAGVVVVVSYYRSYSLIILGVFQYPKLT